jgi:hypothetical protein
MKTEIPPAGRMAAQVVDRVPEVDAGCWDCGRRQVRDREDEGVEQDCAGRDDTAGYVQSMLP